MAFQKTTRLRIGLAFGFLGFLVTFEPAICRGQAGINPDHCETPEGRSVPTVKTATDASGNTSKFQGKSVPIQAQQISASAVVVWNNAAIEAARDRGA